MNYQQKRYWTPCNISNPIWHDYHWRLRKKRRKTERGCLLFYFHRTMLVRLSTPSFLWFWNCRSVALFHLVWQNDKARPLNETWKDSLRATEARRREEKLHAITHKRPIFLKKDKRPNWPCRLYPVHVFSLNFKKDCNLYNCRLIFVQIINRRHLPTKFW